MDPFERAAYREVVEARRTVFRVHLWVYLAVQVFLIVTWWLTSNGEGMPWFLFPLLGWGVGIVAHYATLRGGPKLEPPSRPAAPADETEPRDG